MSELLMHITLLGEGATNPALPAQNLGGILKVKNGNLVFTNGNFTYKIPMEHIDNLYTYNEFSSWGDTWRFALTIFLTLGTWLIGFPVLYYLFYWEWTAYQVRIEVTAWDEYHGLKATTTFALSRRKPDRDRAKRIIKEIWEERGIVRRSEHSENRVIIRDI